MAFQLRNESSSGVGGGGGESLYVEYTSARLCAKNAGGALCARGVFAGHYSTSVKRM